MKTEKEFEVDKQIEIKMFQDEINIELNRINNLKKSVKKEIEEIKERIKNKKDIITIAENDTYENYLKRMRDFAENQEVAADIINIIRTREAIKHNKEV